MSKLIDEKRYSRQILSLGKLSQLKLSNSIIRVNNLEGGLGTEVCKNLVLQGVGTLILNDKNEIVDRDMEVGFYYNKSGVLRESVLYDNLCKLNPSCKIYYDNEYSGDINLDIYLNMTIDMLIELLKLNPSCPIIYSCTGGCRGFIFNDFKNHVIDDLDGEASELLVIESLNKIDNEIEIKTVGYHNLCDNDIVKFTNIEGKNIDFLNNEFRVIIKNSNTFKILSIYSEDFHFNNGNVRKVKKPIIKKFNNISDELIKPTLEDDWMNMERPSVQFERWIKSERLLEDKLELCAVNSYFGGLVCSEAIKYITNKYNPINQWYFWEDTSYLNYDESGKTMIEKILGRDVYNKVINSKWFMVGAGAIGCEMLKNLSLLKVGSGDGKIILTDPDTIEVSNLSRQFLFGSDDVNRSKSVVAGERVMYFNSDLNVESYQDKMCVDSESKYDSKFYNGLDGIINALDNYEARLYMDRKAVEYGLPLLESGTQGSKGNTQPIIPNLTENYGASSDPPESESYPLCTIKNFPNKPEHVIHYISELYDSWFSDFAYKVNNYLDNNDMLDELTNVERNDLIKKLNKFFNFSSDLYDQVNFWNNFYYSIFRDNILHILNSYPRDHMIDGELFWKGGKKCPNIPDDSLKYNFIICSLKISEKLFDIKYDINEKELKEFIDNLEEVKPLISTNKVAIEDKDLKDDDNIVELNYDIIKVNLCNLNVLCYDKDIESDYNWLYYGSLIRGTSYGIEFPDILKVRQISGKIIPAMATTTSMVAGLISLELLKYYVNVDVCDYRSYFLNLALNNYLYSEPKVVQIKSVGKLSYSIWDKFEECDDMTINSFLEKYSKLFGTEIDTIVSDERIIYAPFITDDDDLIKKLSELDLGKKYSLLLSDEDESNYPEIYINLE